MYTIGQIYDAIDGFAPFGAAEDWDNVGLLVGGRSASAGKVLVALDVTAPVIEEARLLGAGLIVTHHPVIFSGLKAIEADSIPWLLVRAGVSVISAHTNLDVARGGVNDALAEAVGLREARPMLESGLGRVGRLDSPMMPEAFAAHVKMALNTPAVRYSDTGRAIKTVALCGGGGGAYFDDALAAGADAYLTGEAKHHLWLQAMERGVCLVEAGHFHTEDVAVPALARRLEELLPGLEAGCSRVCTDGVKAV